MTKLAQIDFPNLIVPQDPTARFKIDDTLTLGVVITQIIPFIFYFAGIGLLFYLITGGFKIMTAAGDPKKVQEGQHIITNAFFGFVLIFFAFLIVKLIAVILGLTTITDIFS